MKPTKSTSNHPPIHQYEHQPLQQQNEKEPFRDEKCARRISLDDLSSAFQAILSGSTSGIGKKSSNTSSRNSSRKGGVPGGKYITESIGVSSGGNAMAAVTVPSITGGSECCQSDNSAIDDRSSERFALRSSGANSSNVDRMRSRSEESLLEPGSGGGGGGGSSSCRSDKILSSFNSDRKSVPKFSSEAGGGSISTTNSLSQHHKQHSSGGVSGGSLQPPNSTSGVGVCSRASNSTSPRPASSRILGSRYDLVSTRRRFPSAHELGSAHQKLWVELWVDVWVDDECNTTLYN